MIWNIIFIGIWLRQRKNMNLAQGWRTFWVVMGVVNSALLAWNLLVLLAVLSQV